jgi:hypothetical protein
VGETVTAAAPVAKLVAGDELVAWMALPAAHRASVTAGDVVRLRFDEHPAEEAGFGRATVVRVSDDPLSAGLADPMLVAQAERAPHHLLELRLEALPPRGAERFRNAMQFTGEVVLREQRIISLLWSF